MCTRCGLGLLVSAPPEAAPSPQDPFLLVDGQLSICAVSRPAEQLLLTSETEVVNTHISDLLVPADIEIAGPESLVNLRRPRRPRPGRDPSRRPAPSEGVRDPLLGAHRPVRPPRAALIVLADGRA